MINARKIKRRLAECGLTQKDAAIALGIATATMSQKINGFRPLYLNEAEELAKLLQIDRESFSGYFFSS